MAGLRPWRGALQLASRQLHTSGAIWPAVAARDGALASSRTTPRPGIGTSTERGRRL